MGNGSSMDAAKVVYFDFSGRKEKVVYTRFLCYLSGLCTYHERHSNENVKN